MMATAVQIDTSSPFGTYRARGCDRLAWRLIDGGGVRARLRRHTGGLVRRLFPGPYDTEIDGLRFRIYPGENYDDRKMLARARLPEQAEHRLLALLLGPNTVFVDVGANVGTYAIFAARRGARVLAVEASAATAAKLAFNIAANQAGDIDVAPVAVGAERGRMTLWSSASNIGFASLAAEFVEAQRGDWQAQEVEVRPLAELLGESGLGRVDVLKIDVEGYEDRVLLPYLDGLARRDWPGAVLMETNCSTAWQQDPRDLLLANGYEVAGETADNVLLVDARKPQNMAN